MLQGNSPDATFLSMPYAPGTLRYVLVMFVPVSKFVTTALVSLSRMTNRHGHWVCWTSMGGKAAHTHCSVENVVEVAVKRRLLGGHVSHT